LLTEDFKSFSAIIAAKDHPVVEGIGEKNTFLISPVGSLY